MRPRIYPDTEELINAKIKAKLAKVKDETSTSKMNQPAGGNRDKNTLYMFRVVCKQLLIKDFQLKYADIHHLEKIWTELNNIEGVSLNVEKNGLKKYEFPKLEYDHVLGQVLSPDPVAVLGDDILTPLSQETKNGLQAFINPLIMELENCLPSF
ncbi:uncharacterized protein EV154DRAFT_486200 [Mucor mucedo]|uniref:uncharacterized protein n=1 Tax=Mucor mucedo TaxID=29922 RepID=UPI00221F72EC|nr:uncharacterized protein EV154DRAFT_486200 [Mucor mucedo]KAI7878368.1 hypothetical protein EV154DRAFT_486200 [Mucor mucedo]